MTTPPLFPGFDGLMKLSRREGVDIRPTLLRVLTDLYVQASAHTPEEERQFVELTSRLIEQVDDATRAAVRARLAIYPHTPAEITRKLRLQSSSDAERIPLTSRPSALTGTATSPEIRAPAGTQAGTASPLSLDPRDASEISDMFFAAGPSERVQILHNLAAAPLKPSARLHPGRAKQAIETLHMAAFAADTESFTAELGDALILPARVAAQVVSDPGGEALACAAKAVGIPGAVFQQILLFLKPEIGSSVNTVYRLSRLYDALSERAALVMLAAWRGATVAHTRARYRPSLYDDERHRSRPASVLGNGQAAPSPGSAVIGRGIRGSSGN